MIGNYRKKLGKLIQERIPYWIYKTIRRGKETYSCPICNYQGPFQDEVTSASSRKNTRCPKCGSTERNRMLWLVVHDELLGMSNRRIKALHFAPEKQISAKVRELVDVYETSRFDRGEADHVADLRALPFDAESYDFVIASHVLEHIEEDEVAIKEIERVLIPGGVAVLPVPLCGETTVEYNAPRPEESGHVRAPGIDYFDRYRIVFDFVVIRSAEEYSASYHLVPEMEGALGIHYIPVCTKRTV